MATTHGADLGLTPSTASQTRKQEHTHTHTHHSPTITLPTPPPLLPPHSAPLKPCTTPSCTSHHPHVDATCQVPLCQPPASLPHLRRPIKCHHSRLLSQWGNKVLITAGDTSLHKAQRGLPWLPTTCTSSPLPPSSACQGPLGWAGYGQQGQSMSSSSHCKSAHSIIMLCHNPLGLSCHPIPLQLRHKAWPHQAALCHK